MKILFFVSGLGAGGKERRLTELMKELKYHPEFQFELVIMSHDIHYEEVFDLDIKIHYLIRKIKKDPTVIFKFYKLCKTINPDIVHCWDSMTASYCAPICKLLRIKLINGMIADAQKQKNLFDKSRFRALLTFPLSNIIVGNSQAGISAYQAPQNKSIVIYNGFNFKRIESLQNNDEIKRELKIHTKSIVGMVATFSSYKDYKTYFNAAKILLDRGYDVTFLALGYKTDSNEAINLIDNKYLNSFRLLGKRTGIESYVNIMNVCVLSTFTEGISNSILEYMALGKPVVATDGGGTKEIVEDNKTGFLVSPSNPEELAGKIEILLNDSDMQRKMGHYGYERVNKEFSIGLMVNKYMNLYKNIKKS